jgi:hypothetical protein
MADSKQSSDSAQTGPGTKVTGLTPKSPYTPAPKPTATSPSGSTQSTSRGKQG